jgi:hypothetical protein
MLEYYPIDFSTETFQSGEQVTEPEPTPEPEPTTQYIEKYTDATPKEHANEPADLEQNTYDLYYKTGDSNTVYDSIQSLGEEFVPYLNDITDAITNYTLESGTDSIVEKTLELYKKLKDDSKPDHKKVVILFLNALYCNVTSVKNVIPNSYWYHYINTPQGKKNSKWIKNNLKLSMYCNNMENDEPSNIYLDFNKPKSEFTDELKELWKIDPFTKYIRKTIINTIVLGVFVLLSFISFIASSNKVISLCICLITSLHAIRVIHLITGNGKIKDGFKNFDDIKDQNNSNSLFSIIKNEDLKTICKNKFTNIYNKLNFYDISDYEDEMVQGKSGKSAKCISKKKDNKFTETEYYGTGGKKYNSNCIQYFIQGKNRFFNFLMGVIGLIIISIIIVLVNPSNKGLFLITSPLLLIISISIYVTKHKKLIKHLPLALQKKNVNLPFITHCSTNSSTKDISEN